MLYFYTRYSRKQYAYVGSVSMLHLFSNEVFALLIQALSVITDVFVVTPSDFFLHISLRVMLMK